MRDADLSQRLQFPEYDFLTALEGGAAMLASYYQRWSPLLDILRNASQTGGVGRETLSLAHSVASRIENLASCFLDIRREEESFTISLQRDCDAMLQQMAALDLNANPKSAELDNRKNIHPSCSYSSTSISNTDPSPPPFLAAVHRWLLDNLHNPYPSAEVKALMAASSSCQVSSINSWFINARRRIGWTTLCREHFSNCRANMIDAAYRALVEEDPQRALSPGLQHLFIAMKVATEDLYSSTLTRSTFSGDLDAIVKSFTKEKCVEKCRPADLTKAVQGSYPSPDPTVTASPVTAISDSLTDESNLDEAVIAGSKRRRPSVEPVDLSTSAANRPMKRLRASVTSQTSLPSPPSSTHDIHESLHCSSPELPHAHSTPPDTNEVLPSRKRRLSDAKDIRMPKRLPDLVAAAPGLQTVPDPLACSDMENECSIDDWFHANFDDLFVIPPPVEATAPDFSDAASWEVELFQDYSIPGEPKHGLERPPAPAAYIPPPSDLSDLDSLLQSIGSDFITPSLLPPIGTGNPYTSSLDSSTPDISHTNLDWSSLLNCTEVYQPSVYSTFSQYPSQPLPEIDLSMLQLPQAMANVNSRGESASKQAKLQQLQAMQEAVWRMEQELRSEGVVI